MPLKPVHYLVILTLIIFAVVAAGSFPVLAAAPFDRLRAGSERPLEVAIEARQFSYDPPIISITQGQRVKLTLHSMDASHGLYLDGYGVEISALPGSPEEVEFVADRPGQFHFRCTLPCGPLHPFMVGKLVVTPNVPFNTSIALAALISLALPGYFWLTNRRSRPSLSGDALTQGTVDPRTLSADTPAATVLLDLSKLPVVASLLRRRGFQFSITLLLLSFFVLALVAGFFGSPVGGQNFATIFVWVVWWSLLILLFVPLGGRLWCAVCPVPSPGEWLQRMSFVHKQEGRLLTLGLKWPSRLRGIWVQNGIFLLIALFSAIVFTSPAVTATVLAAYLGVSLIMALFFRGRTFCRYVCPLGGFIGRCASVAPLALRVTNREVCRRHTEKECLRGSTQGYGCPWFEYPGAMEGNAYCGLCMECVKTCSKGNIAIGLQPVGRDLLAGKGRLDEAYAIFIAFAAVIFYSAVMAGPWGWMKTLAGNPFAPQFGLYAIALLGVSVVVIPGLFLATAWLSRLLSGARRLSVVQLWKDLSYGLTPFVLSAWIALSLSLLLVGGTHVAQALSDPLGRGWNIFGTVEFEGKPMFMDLLPYLQMAVVLMGLAWSIATSWQLVARAFARQREALLALAPFVLFLFVATATFLWLHIG